MWNVKKVTFIKAENRVMSARSWEVREMGKCWSKDANAHLQDE